ncbi:MAG: rRNA maturation RNase YbeY [Stigonema ocellatum SAG 48.90 = DSM 106950]|nr:rRNA maturation RNase YbeY [Stigonema ocellatum SAG 48.90 = DSM 106950]
MQVELYLQNFCDEPSQTEAVNSGDTDPQITAETWDNWFKCWLEILHPNLPKAPIYELGLRLTDDNDIQALNAQYRHQNQPTDVLAFAALEVDCPQPAEMLACESLYLGDIVISIDRAKQQAQQQEHPLPTELAWLASHGLLHLLGWDHPDEESLSRMLKQQVILLKTIGMAIDIE